MSEAESSDLAQSDGAAHGTGPGHPKAPGSGAADSGLPENMPADPVDATPARTRLLADDPVRQNVVSSDRIFEGAVWDLRRDSFEYGDTQIVREYVDHPGAVAIMAMDEEDNVLLIKQYRHPIAARDWELPAGLLDVADEPPLDAAKRELAEEADLVAEDWHLLVEFFSSPGGSNETIRVYLARGLSATLEPFERFAEEAEIEVRWALLDDIVDSVLERNLTNSILGIAALAASAARARDWVTLGDPNELWPWHPKLRDQEA